MNGPEIAQKGVNRCDAVSYQELLDEDPLAVPPFMRFESSVDLGVEPIAASRYTSQEFFDREVASVWLKTWQYVCREEEIPEPGDMQVFDLVGRSAVVVRQRDGGLKAMRNVCLHRGRKLITKNGCHTQLRCPFHGFSWNLDGSFAKNPTKWDFPQIDEAKFSLPEIALDSWGGFIFINFDPDAAPLASIAAPMPEHFAHWQIAECHQIAHVAKVVPVNWKAAIEAFIESHHVLTTHPQISPYTGDANTQYDILSDHVCRFITPLGTPSPLIDNPNLTPAKIVENWFSKGSRAGAAGPGDGFAEGQRPRDYAARIARKTWGERTGRDYSEVAETDLIDAISYHMFPAFGLWGGIGSHIGYRWRPWEGRVDRTLMEIYLFAPNAVGAKPPAPAPLTFLGEEEAWATASELGYLGPVFDQDQANFGPLQEGLTAMGDDMLQFGRYSEIRCRQLHRAIDRYMAADEA